MMRHYNRNLYCIISDICWIKLGFVQVNFIKVLEKLDIWLITHFVIVTKQKHPGCKKCGTNKERPYLCTTKSFDISWGQEVTYQRCFKLLKWHTIVYSILSQVWLALSLGHLFSYQNYYNLKRWQSDKANHTCENMLLYVI